MSPNNNLWNNPKITPCQTVDILGVEVLVKREDLNHPQVQGNKLRKLKYNFKQAQQEKAKTIVTFGGAYSNHLLATAYAAKECGFQSLGFVRGDELEKNVSKWSDTLNRCHQYGMHLVFISRSDYRLKEKSSKVSEVIKAQKAPYVVAEGGSNLKAILGMSELIKELDEQIGYSPSHVFCPVGTGGTYAGIIHGVSVLNWSCKVFGVSVIKSLHEEKKQIKQWLSGLALTAEHQILEQFNGGGYAKNTPELAGFGIAFEQKKGIKLDKIYNTKSFYALAQLIKAGEITSHDKPLIVHTGGIQGGTNTTNDINK